VGLRLENILVPIAFDETSDSALERSIALAADYRADVTLFHAVAAPILGRSSDAASAARLDAKERLRALGKGRVRELRKLHAWRGAVFTDVAVGAPAVEIVAAAERLEADAIVLSPRARSGFAHWVSPSTTERVLRHAPCPVFVVQPAAPAALDAEVETAASALELRLAV
jgi:nucleotide-binding universal stress UspA family protein